MKKNFRNRFFAVSAAAVMSFLLLSGFDSSLTVEDITGNMQTSMMERGGMSCDVVGTADASIDVTAGGETQSLPISGSLDYSIQMTVEPFAMAISGSAAGDASAMGMSGGIELEMYMLELEDGSGVMYMRLPQGEDTAWHAAALSSDYMESTVGAVKAAFSGDTQAAAKGMGLDLSALQEKFGADAQLAPEAVNVNGIDCYEITQTVDGDTLYGAVSEVLSAMPQAGIDSSSLAAFQMLFSGIRMDTVTDCSVEDFAPVYASVDLSGSDFGMIAQMFGAMTGQSQDASQIPEVKVNVNALNVAMNYSEAPEQIEVPAEALAAEIETTLSMDDLTNAAQAAE